MRRRGFLSASATLLAPAAVYAQAGWPDHPLKLIVPFAAGSSTDTVGREVARFLSKGLGQTVVVDNRPGALATIGAADVARAKPDGYTLLLGSNTSLAAAPSLFRKLPYDPIKDFEPIGRIGAVSFVLVVRNDLPVASCAELAAYGKSHEGTPLTWGYANAANRVAGAAVVAQGGFKATAVPYKGVPQMIADMLGGQVDFMVADLTNLLPQIKAGKLRALAVTSPQPSPDLPDVPTLAQSMKGFSLLGWYSLMAPAGTPAPVSRRLSQELMKGLADPETQAHMQAAGLLSYPADGPALGAYLRTELVKWTELAHAAGIEPE